MVSVLRYSEGPGVVVDVERLIASRMLIQANSGGGKSHALRQLLEETHGRVPHLIIDPEGEFASLRERFDYVLAAKSGGDVVAHPGHARLLCRRLVELGASAVLDLYDLMPRDRRVFVREFVGELVALPKSLWRPLIVVIDEAHQFAPEKGHGEAESLEAIISLTTLGRKRGFCPILATQRIAKLHKDVAADLKNKLVGNTSMDIDVERAGNDLGFDKAQRRTLRDLDAGEFYAVGPAIGREVVKVRTGAVKTTHPEAGKVAAAPPPAPARVRSMLSQLATLPQEAEAEARSIDDLKREVARLTGELKRAQRPAPAVPAGPTAEEFARVQRQLAEAEQRNAHAAADIRCSIESLATVSAALDVAGSKLEAERVTIAPARKVEPPKRVAVVSPAKTNGKHAPAPTDAAGRDAISGPERRVLDALAWLEAIGIDQPERAAVAIMAKYSPTSSSFTNPCGTLRTAGLISYPGASLIALTDAGRSLAIMPDSSPTTSELHQRVLGVIDGPGRRVLSPLLESYPDPLSREDLANASGYSLSSSSFTNPLGRLRTFGLIDYPSPGTVRACDLLFPAALP